MTAVAVPMLRYNATVNGIMQPPMEPGRK